MSLTCTVTAGNFTNRVLDVTADTVLPVVCWDACVACGSSGGARDVTFQLNLNTYTGSYTNVNINGTFNGWCGDCAPMTDDNGDGIYEILVPISADTIDYKFTLDGWNIEEVLTEGASCTRTVDGFTNRMLTPTSDTVLAPVCWESCLDCSSSITEIELRNSMEVFPNPANTTVNVLASFSKMQAVTVNLMDLSGRVLNTQKFNGLSALNTNFDVSNLSAGVYMLQLVSVDGVAVKQVSVSK